MGDRTKLIKRKVQLVLDIVNETPHDAPHRAGSWAATRLLFDDIYAALSDPEFPYEAGENFNLPYVQNQASSFQSYVDYYFGLADFDDVKPGDTANLVHFAHKFMGFLPTA